VAVGGCSTAVGQWRVRFPRRPHRRRRPSARSCGYRFIATIATLLATAEPNRSTSEPLPPRPHCSLLRATPHAVEADLTYTGCHRLPLAAGGLLSFTDVQAAAAAHLALRSGSRSASRPSSVRNLHARCGSHAAVARTRMHARQPRSGRVGSIRRCAADCESIRRPTDSTKRLQ
jgi:hypothetical protein